MNESEVKIDKRQMLCSSQCWTQLMTSKCNGSIKPKFTTEGQTLLYHIFYGTITLGNKGKPNTDTVCTYNQPPPHECSKLFCDVRHVTSSYRRSEVFRF